MNNIDNADALTHPRLISPLARTPLTCTFSSAIGLLGLRIQQERLAAIELLDKNSQQIAANDPLSKEVIAQLNAYFSEPHFSFTLPLHISGTPFQQRFYQSLQNIGVGNVASYSDIATELRSAPRAIGQACRRNPLPIVIPCHRVIAKNHLGGYVGAICGDFMEIKKWLLRHEGFLAQ